MQVGSCQLKDMLMGLFSKSGTDTKDEINVNCGDILDISKAADFHQELKTVLGKGGEIVLDASEIERIDVTALQLCTALFRDAAARKVQAKWRAPSDALIKAANLLGLSQELGLPGNN